MKQLPRPKIAILKKFLLSDGKHFRFYSATYDGRNRLQRPRPIVFNLEPVVEYNKRGEQYPILNIHTEKDLVMFIRDNFGYGEFWVYAMLKGREGIWTFWRGSIQEDGWIFSAHEYKRSDVERIDVEMANATSEEEKLTLQQDREFAVDLAKDENKGKRYGFSPFLRPSGRRGSFNMWDEPDRARESEQKPKSERRNVDPSKMSLDEINSFE